MKKRIFCLMAVAMLLLGASCSAKKTPPPADIPQPEPSEEVLLIALSQHEELWEPVALDVENYILPGETQATQAEVDMIAILTMAEAEGECEEGQRLVIDTVLNRLDSPHYPDTIQGVIQQKNQFSSLWDGRIDKCYAKPELVTLVREELDNRLDHQTIFYRTERYSDYGVPLFKVGNHYFSSYD